MRLRDVISWSALYLALAASQPLVRAAAGSPLIISEFMAVNANGIRDEDGDRPDWIEIANQSGFAASLDGWFLSDDPANLAKWRFPAVTVPANGFLLVWASGKDRTTSANRLHTNFRLNKAGDFLALVDSGSNIASAFSPAFPPQQADISYGRDRIDPSILGYFPTPTPGAPNPTSGAGFAIEPSMSLASGIYTNDVLSLAITAATNATVRYTLDGTAPTTSSAVYTGPLALSANSVVKARAFVPGLLPSPIAVRTCFLADSSARDFSSSLPVLLLTTLGRAVPNDIPSATPRPTGGVIAIDNAGGRASLRDPPQFAGVAGYEEYGTVSAGYPKIPLILEIQDTLGNDLNVPLLGMPADADWRLGNPFSDKTFLNEFLGFELHEKMGHYAVRRRFVEVFVDTGGGKLSYPQDYAGIMLLMEKIEVDKNRVNIAELTPNNTTEPEITGGYIFKKDKSSIGDLDFATAGNGGPPQPLKLHEPKPNELRVSSTSGPLTPAGSNQLNYLVAYLNQFESALYSPNWRTATGTNHYSAYIDVDSFVDQHWIVEFTKQIDGYRLSTYFTKDRNGKVKMEPIWNWFRSFGNANFAEGGLTNGWYYPLLGEVDHTWLRRLLADPDFAQRIADRWSMLRTNVFNITNLIDHTRALVGSLNESVARDFQKYPRLGTYVYPNPDGTGDGRDVDYVHPTTYVGSTSNSIIGQMHHWMLGRYLWIDSQFVGTPAFAPPAGVVSNGAAVTINATPGATVYFTLDGTDPRAPGGDVAATAQPYTGPIPITSTVRVTARARANGSWLDTWSGPAATAFFNVPTALRITEIMYHPTPPPPGIGTNSENFEFIEVRNIGSAPLNVSHFTLSGGVAFDFPNVTLAPGQFAVIVSDVAAFESRYGTNALILGAYGGHLGNKNDHIVLTGSHGEVIHDFTYADGWYPATDGFGFSLVVRDETAPPTDLGRAAAWRASFTIGGSPGSPDPVAPGRPRVVVNEVLAHSAPPLTDYIELHNDVDAVANIGGWFLTDDFHAPAKYRIPAGTTIAPGGYIVIDESAINASPGSPTSFTLNAAGGTVFLFSADGTNLSGYAHGFEFGPSATGVSFGRYIPSTGAEYFVAQQQLTPNAPNSGPVVGPVVISEIMYAPADELINGWPAGENMADEYIELRNISGSTVQLFDPANPTNTWHVTNAVSFAFPPNATIPAGGFCLVVSFDPAADASATEAFRARNLVPVDVPIFGPWAGHLDDAADTIELRRADVPQPEFENQPEPIIVPYILVDKVSYSNGSPWPSVPGAFGISIQRIAVAAYGNDPTNWVGAAPSPGAPLAGGTPPVITSQPADKNVVIGSNVTLAVSATGTQPLRYQWQFNHHNISGATNSTLTLSNVQPENVGVYDIAVFNGAGVAMGTNFVLGGRIGLQLLQQPVSHFVFAGTSTNFSVVATSGSPIHYQWLFNGNPLPGATNSIFNLTNIQSGNEGTYRAVVSDGFDTITSAPATLATISAPAFTLQPISQAAVEGGSVTFSAAADGTTPIAFRWRTNGITIAGAPVVSGSNYSALTLNNVATTFDGYRVTVVATNITGTAAVSATAILTVLRDSDHDGLPDAWEQTHAGFNANEPSDASRDDDEDRMSNRDEYIAGTDYLDPSSVLRLQLAYQTNTIALQFLAVSNRTYTLQYSDGISPLQWHKLADILAHPTNRTETVTDSRTDATRFYRIALPIQP